MSSRCGWYRLESEVPKDLRMEIATTIWTFHDSSFVFLAG